MPPFPLEQEDKSDFFIRLLAIPPPGPSQKKKLQVLQARLQVVTQLPVTPLS
jgi:hypothetical protein